MNLNESNFKNAINEVINKSLIISFSWRPNLVLVINDNLYGTTFSDVYKKCNEFNFMVKIVPIRAYCLHIFFTSLDK